MLADINSIRIKIGLSPKLEEKEKGIKGKDGFYWGFPDGVDELKENNFIYYEIEDGQQHQCTNVLKCWPLLEEDENINIVLIQWLKKKSKSKNRWELGKFVAKKMVQAFPERFKYVFLELQDESNEEKLQLLKKELNIQF